MDIKVTGKDVISTLVVIGLDIAFMYNDKEYELQLNVKYDSMLNFGTTDISWEVSDYCDDDILEEEDVYNQVDDFVQEYIQENIGKL